MAGSVTSVALSLPGLNATKYTLGWTSDGSGDVNTNPLSIAPGQLRQVQFIPGTAGDQPSNLYDVSLSYNGADLLAGDGVDLSNAASSFKSYNNAPILYDGEHALYLVVAGAGAAKKGTVVLWIG